MAYVTGMETTNGMDPVLMYHREGYFHYKCGNVNTSFDR
jgi:hypothetical protein